MKLIILLDALTTTRAEDILSPGWLVPPRWSVVETIPPMAFGLEGKGQRLGDRWRSGFGYKKTICVWGVTVAMVRLPASAKDRICQCWQVGMSTSLGVYFTVHAVILFNLYHLWRSNVQSVQVEKFCSESLSPIVLTNEPSIVD